MKVRPGWLMGMACAARLALNTTQAAESPKPAPKIDAEAQQALQKMAEFFKGLRGVKTDLKMKVLVEMQGIKQEMPSEYSIAFERPNRYALVLKSGMMGVTMVSDGSKLWTYMPMFNKYTEAAAPANLESLETAPETSMGGSLVNSFLFSKDPYQQIMDGVTNAQYAGKQKLDDTEYDHLKLFQNEFNWELWLESGQRPLPRKITMDMAKITERVGTDAAPPAGISDMMKGMKMVMNFEFSNWQINPKSAATDFQFTPPKDAEKSDSLFPGIGQEEPHPLLGQPAPEFGLQVLDGKEMRLASHKGKDVVVLDFWATWCGPCVKALPVLLEVTGSFKGKGVTFYAVNEEEDESTIREFLKRRDLKLPVALDEEGKVGKLYQVEGIPQTVLIDTNGLVQAVHVGLLPNLKEKLEEELKTLLAGKSLSEAVAKSAEATHLEGMDTAWAVQGRWSGVAVDLNKEKIYALGHGGKGVELDASGSAVGRFQLDDAGAILRTANLTGDKGKEFVTFSVWGRAINAYASDGTLLWTYPGGQGVDDVYAADLDKDGLDEVVVGYNGSTGLHVLAPRGSLLWKSEGIGNVWHVSAGNLYGDSALEVITTSAAGKIHVFDSSGKKIKDLAPGFYANMVRVQGEPADSKAGLILAAGGSKNDGQIAALDANSKVKWSSNTAGSIGSAEPAAGKPWVAVASLGGELIVLDTSNGKLIARTGGQGRRPELSWLEQGGSPLLLVATGSELNAFRLK